MNWIRCIFYLLLFFSLNFPGEVSASHIIGGEITYTAVPGNPYQYNVTVKLYRDCFGILYPDTSIQLYYYSSSACGPTGSAWLNRLPSTGVGNDILTGTYPRLVRLPPAMAEQAMVLKSGFIQGR